VNGQHCEKSETCAAISGEAALRTTILGRKKVKGKVKGPLVENAAIGSNSHALKKALTAAFPVSHIQPQ
jgi:hypothetical protein